MGILSEFRWNYRVLLVFTPYRSDNNFLQQKKMVENNRAGFDDRDIVVIEIIGDKVLAKNHPFKFAASIYRSKFGVSAPEFRTFLIGKDGYIKYKSPLPSDPCHLFGLIDLMPMRRREISNGSGANACVN